MAVPELKKATEIMDVLKKHNIGKEQLTNFITCSKNVIIQVACNMPSPRDGINDVVELQEDMAVCRDSTKFLEDLLVVFES